jgi:ABC-type transport system involved in multi-copper enzyme maturation permease subunit
VSALSALTRVFLQDLVRRKILWLFLAAIVAVVALSGLAQSSFEDSIGHGESMDMATRRAKGLLDKYAEMIRSSLLFVGFAVGVQMAPEARKNGTTQFALSLGVSRVGVAVAQFTALALFSSGLVLIIHVGFCVAGFAYLDLSIEDVALAWWPIWFHAMGATLAAFSLSMTMSVIESLLVLAGIPFLLLVLRNSWEKLGVSDELVVRWGESASLLFPDMTFTVSWPYLRHPVAGDFRWYVVHEVLVLLLWLTVGYWRLRAHQYGSRTAVK